MSIVRVPANDSYSCLMLKNQRFSSLFRHYSKHHGLPRDCLEFSFTSKLYPDDTPESVHLQRGDVITVRKIDGKNAPKEDKIPQPDDNAYFEMMFKLLENETDTDIVFLVGKQQTRVKAHRLILMARSEVFRAMLDRRRCGNMRESMEGEIRLEEPGADSVRRMLEYIYTNRVKNLEQEQNEDHLIELIGLAEKYLLPELKYLGEAAAVHLITDDTIGRLLFASEQFNAEALKKKCIDYILVDPTRLTAIPSFREEVQQYPALALTLLDAAAAASVAEPNRKRRKVSGTSLNAQSDTPTTSTTTTTSTT